ncbi:hypothetical protein Hanom_Chr09g00759671 [Helianthus anomalus]
MAGGLRVVLVANFRYFQMKHRSGPVLFMFTRIHYCKIHYCKSKKWESEVDKVRLV